MMIARLRPMLLRPDAERDPADDRAKVHHRREDSGRVGVEVMLLLQEGRIEVLRAVAEEVERGHQHDEVERDLPVAHQLHDRVRSCLAAARLERRTFLDVHADEQDEQRRRNPDHEHAAPADPVEQQIEDEAGDEIAGRIAALEKAGDWTAQLGGNRFHDQARAEPPFAAHADAEQEAQHEQTGQCRREAGGKLEDREEDDVGHQHRAAAEMLGQPAEEEGADRPRCERQEDAFGDRLHVGAELLGDGREHEHHQEEVEGVERPAEIARPDRAALRRFERFQIGDQAHAAAPLTGISPSACRSACRQAASPRRQLCAEWKALEGVA